MHVNSVTIATTAAALLASTSSTAFGMPQQAETGTLITPRIIAGSSASQGEFGSAVHLTSRISNNGTSMCGGTLIGESWIVTAGHCTVDPRTAEKLNPDDITVYAGSIYNGTAVAEGKGASIVTAKVSKIVRHPNFAFDLVQGPLSDDIALFQLATPLKLSSTDVASGSSSNTNSSAAYITRARIASNAPQTGGSITPVGWGLMNETDRATISTVLQKTEMTVAPASICTQVRTNYQQDGQGPTICSTATTSGVCKGDSGSGVYMKVPTTGENLLVGLTSFGTLLPGLNASQPTNSNTTFCMGPNSVAFFTRIGYYSDWITKTTGLSMISLTVNTSASTDAKSPGSSAVSSMVMTPLALVAAAFALF
ncbi:trypsin-like serine protease [Ramicandelaber brevisporus]|nr:trypsin-like serine protease [Ramicandelaber brevisporus]